MEKVAKPLLIFVMLLLTLGANLPEDVAGEFGINTNFLLIALCVIVAVWMIKHLHIFFVSVILIMVVASFLPGHQFGLPTIDNTFISISFIVIIGVWLAARVSKVIGALFMVAGLMIFVPTGVVDAKEFDPQTLAAILCALILTPVIDMLTTGRKSEQ
ncbi:MAG: hypothetical protein HQL50_04540 [Magnetococcales bacterium]|nr:hypothetical protein [Magnetococcales bacterium]